MKVLFYLFLSMQIFTFSIGCAPSSKSATIEEKNLFAIELAQFQLWNEAIFRWKKIIELNPKYAIAYNNLGVAYEASEQIRLALEAYEHALKLEPNNQYFRSNLDRCRETRHKVLQ